MQTFAFRVGSFLALFAVALLAAEYFAKRPVLISSAHAAELPAVWQRKVENLSKNMDRLRESIATSDVEASDTFRIEQWRDRIENFRSSLARVPESDDPLMEAAEAKFAELEQTFAKLQPAGAATTSAEPAASTQEAAVSQQGDGPQLVSGQRVRVKKLARDIAGTRSDMVRTGPSPLQDAAVVEAYQERVNVYSQGIERYADYRHDPDVQAAEREFEQLTAAIAEEQARARAQVEQIGDAQAILAKIEQALGQHSPPGELYPPFGDAEAKQWVLLAARAQQVSQAAAQEIQRIAPLAYLPETRGTVQQGAAYDRQDLDRLFRSANETTKQVNDRLAATKNRLIQQFDNQDRQLDFFRKLDPNDSQQRSMHFLDEGAQERIYGRLDRQLALARSVAAFQRALGEQPAGKVVARIEEIRNLRAQYAEGRRQALGDSRLPEPRSTDSRRLAVAEKILANPEYEFGTHGPIVLTTPEIVTRQKEVSRDTIKDVDFSLSGTITLSGTRETWNYEWDEFKFATPLQEDNGDWYIWWITARNYKSGWAQTPIGRWVSGAAVRGDRILEDNF